MLVMKFGGSSVAGSAALARVRAIIAAERRPRVVVVSALGGVTDTLLALAARAASGDDAAALEALRGLRDRHASLAAVVRDETERRSLQAHLDEGWLQVETLVRSASLLKSCPPAASDAIVAHGELASSRLVAAILREAGLPAEWVDARSVVVTDGRHQHASPLTRATASRLSRAVAPILDRGAIPLLGGFIGSTSEGATTTLGRGGSDYSASLVGACLGAAEIQIWTDVDGMLTADPRILGHARPIDRLSFDEASTLARFGAKVLHPSTVLPAVQAGIPVRILNSRRPASRGTLVTDGPGRRPEALAGIACLQHLCVLDVRLPAGPGSPAALAGVFGACARADAVVHLAAVSDTCVSLAIDDGPVPDEVVRLLGPGPDVRRRHGVAVVAVVGDGLKRRTSLAAEVAGACSGVPLHVLSRGAGTNHVALVVDQADVAAATATLHECFFEGPAVARPGDPRTEGGASPHQARGATRQEIRA